MKASSRRGLYAAYATGPITNGMTDMIAVAVPLWALMLNFSPSEIGIVIGARNVLPLLLGIHSGILMDRFGTRRVLFSIAVLAGITLPLYPLLPWFPALIVLQLISGYATNVGYVGAQALVGRLTGGEAGHFGKLIFITRIGTFIAPILIGAIRVHHLARVHSIGWSATKSSVGQMSFLKPMVRRPLRSRPTRKDAQVRNCCHELSRLAQLKFAYRY